MTAPALDVGQLVRVRGQQWVVSDLSLATLPADEFAASTNRLVAHLQGTASCQRQDALCLGEPRRDSADANGGAGADAEQ